MKTANKPDCMVREFGALRKERRVATVYDLRQVLATRISEKDRKRARQIKRLRHLRYFVLIAAAFFGICILIWNANENSDAAKAKRTYFLSN